MTATTFLEQEREIRDTFRAQVQSKYQDAHPGTILPVYLDNLPASTPSGIIIESPDGLHVRHSIRWGEGRQVALDSVYRYAGVLIVQVFVERDQGNGAALEIAELTKTAFRAKQIAGCIFRVPSAPEYVDDDGTFSQFNITTPFHYDEIVGPDEVVEEPVEGEISI